MYYPAFILPVVEGGYIVTFPDIPEALTQGDTLEESLYLAKDALFITLEEYIKKNKPLPAPSSLEILTASLELKIQEDGIDKSRKPLIQMIVIPDMDKRLVKLNISMPYFILNMIDEKAKLSGMTRSGFLVKAAQAYK